MALPKVFVSSTCYDLGMAREQLRSFITDMGFEPIMSEYSDVLFDPRQHTHTSCMQEIPNADLVVLLVGSRYGGKGVPEALNILNIDKIIQSSFDLTIFEDTMSLSVTQLEILKAIETTVPVFAFVEQKVLHDHLVYEKNKEIIEKINFPSIEKQDTAKYIFEFINFLKHRTKGNSVIGFSKLGDIEDHLRKQWAALFQRLLKESRDTSFESRKLNNISDQIEELKTAILTTIGNTQTRDVARGVVKFRRLVDFLVGLNCADQTIITQAKFDFSGLLKFVKITEVREMPENARSFGSLALLKDDGTFYELRFGGDFLTKTESDWNSFIGLTNEARALIFEALTEMRGIGPNIIRHRTTSFEEYIENIQSSKQESKPIAVKINELFT